MDTENFSRLLSYVVCETTMPVKKHVYNFAVNDQLSMKPQLLSAAALTSKSQLPTNQHQVSSSVSIKEEMSHIQSEAEEIEDVHVVQELAEVTESERSTSGDNTLQVLKRRQSAKEGQSLQPVSKKFKDDVLENVSKDSKSVEKTENQDISDENSPNNSNDPVPNVDPILLCSDSDFRVMYKVSRSSFQTLVEILSGEDLEPIEDLTLQKKVLIVLWLLGNSGSYKEAAQVFQVSDEVASSCFFDVCAALYNKSENFIKWPSSGESEEISSRIEKNFGFPGVVGVLGCQYFTISIPKESLSRREHFNGKLRMYCVALQLVCDDDYVIRDIFPGLPGGTRPAQVLRDSPLGEILATRAAELIDPNKHILASSEFPQLTSMLTPYTKKSEALSKEEEEFNLLHENVSVLVNQTFKMLKDRFKILKFLDPETATMVLVTTCVLHNICILNGDFYNVDEIA